MKCGAVVRALCFGGAVFKVQFTSELASEGRRVRIEGKFKL